MWIVGLLVGTAIASAFGVPPLLALLMLLIVEVNTMRRSPKKNTCPTDLGPKPQHSRDLREAFTIARTQARQKNH